ncbi:conserved hypothetical protein [Devosia sp. YR412]|uniref:EthD domain-containing protein n=1 Tax=Devosia sp. YR412 TaxID=1881030 RepID=UPI0008B8043F|nr:EthD domain-containing protein [Devosia sp. YR412]SEQ10308.1 conserved hypothetical protein [Devosia sp. YR412]
MIKLAFLVKRIEGMSREEFIEYHRNTHAPLFASIPEAKLVRKYVISHPIAAPGFPEPEYDTLTEIYFDTWADYESYFGSENYKTKVHLDEYNFMVQGNYLVFPSEERIIINN